MLHPPEPGRARAESDEGGEQEEREKKAAHGCE
jgi:hypothetical protein